MKGTRSTESVKVMGSIRTNKEDAMKVNGKMT
jgi:hypothetical protein